MDSEEKEKHLYLCNPALNHECSKSGCQFYHRGECYSTTKKEYSDYPDMDIYEDVMAELRLSVR